MDNTNIFQIIFGGLVAVIGYFLKDFHKQNKILQSEVDILKTETKHEISSAVTRFRDARSQVYKDLNKTNNRVDLVELRFSNDVETIKKDIHQINESIKKFDSTIIDSTIIMKQVVDKLNSN